MDNLGKLSSVFTRIALLALLLWGAVLARAQGVGLDAGVAQQVRALALAGARPSDSTLRVEVELGQLDPRLRLAPCERIEPYLPPGTRLWGRTRVGLRCTQGTTPWNVFVPVQVKVYGQALVAAVPLAAGATIMEGDLRAEEVDLAEQGSPALTDPAAALGRSLARALNPGQSVRQAHLKARQWFAAGETVQVVAVGSGFRVAGEGQALTAGVEGQPARVRTESGRVLTGMPAGARRIEMVL